jgi:uncharacterized protein YcbK (DUF882 family)
MSDLFLLENDSAKRYDPAFLQNSIDALYRMVDMVKMNQALYDFPMLIDRVNTGPISPTEYADFLIATGTTQATVEYINATTANSINTVAAQYLNNMDNYYTDNFSSSTTGGICGLYNKFKSFLDKFTINLNLLSGLLSFEKVIHQLIDKIKEKILSTVDQLTKQLGSWVGSIQGIVGQIKDVKNFYSDLSLDSIKNTVSTVIKDIAGKFEIPQTQTDPIAIIKQELDAVAYLLYRFCQLSTAVEGFMNGPLKGLQSAMKQSANIKSILENGSNISMKNAVAAGAFRMSDGTIDSIKSQLGSGLNATQTSTSTSGAASGNDTGAGAATPSKYYAGDITEEEKSMIAEMLSATGEQLRGGSFAAAKYLKFQPQVLSQNDPYDCAGVKELQPAVVVIAIRISKSLGKPLQINSGYRSPAYNAAQPGSAKNSQHMKGLAMDCARAAYGTDFSSGENFIKTASQCGAGGIGTYPTFIHVDAGPRRTWSTIAGSQLGHDNARNLHTQDKFRNG